MPRPTHRIDLLVVPTVPEACPREGLEALMVELRAEQVIDEVGVCGPAARRWMDGGFARLWIDDPGAMTLYSNRQGGFGVRCPAHGTPIVPAFQSALTAWRAGGARRLACPACGGDHALEALTFRPAAAFARVALATSDAGAARLSGWAGSRIAHHLGPTRAVVRRG